MTGLEAIRRVSCGRRAGQALSRHADGQTDRQTDRSGRDRRGAACRSTGLRNERSGRLRLQSKQSRHLKQVLAPSGCRMTRRAASHANKQVTKEDAIHLRRTTVYRLTSSTLQVARIETLTSLKLLRARSQGIVKSSQFI